MSGAIGAEIGGVDLAAPLDEATVVAIREAWLAHLVIFFRGQNLSPDRLMDVASRFGEPVEYPFVAGIDGFPQITPVVKLEHERVNFGGIWHTDTAYLEEPPMGTFLLAREVPEAGGDTLFANMYLAYEALSDGMKRLIDPLVGVNSSRKADASKTREDRMRADLKTEGAGGGARRDYIAEHPVVRTHPETGKKALYVNLGHTAALQGHDRGGKCAAAAVPVRAPGAARIHLPLSLDGGRAGALGQPLRPAQPDQRLPRPPPRDAPGDAGGRSAAIGRPLPQCGRGCANRVNAWPQRRRMAPRAQAHRALAMRRSAYPATAIPCTSTRYSGRANPATVISALVGKLSPKISLRSSQKRSP